MSRYHDSARSVYSNRSHLLSPTSLESGSSSRTQPHSSPTPSSTSFAASFSPSISSARSRSIAASRTSSVSLSVSPSHSASSSTWESRSISPSAPPSVSPSTIHPCSASTSTSIPYFALSASRSASPGSPNRANTTSLPDSFSTQSSYSHLTSTPSSEYDRSTPTPTPRSRPPSQPVNRASNTSHTWTSLIPPISQHRSLRESHGFGHRTQKNSPHSDDRHANDIDDDGLSEIIMAVDMDKDGRVGCAYYVGIDEALHIEDDWVMGGIEAVDTLLLRVQPTTVLLPSRATCALVAVLEKDALSLDDEEPEQRRGSYILRHLVSAEFDPDGAKERLATSNPRAPETGSLEVLRAGDESTHLPGFLDHKKLANLAETVNFDSRLAIGCAGAVLGDLDRRRAADDIPFDNEEPAKFRVLSIEMDTPDSIMSVTADTLISLQILHSELHPNPQSQYSSSLEEKSKESLSIYGLLRALACTAQGKAKLRQMLFRPSTNIDLIRERHNTIALFLVPDNREVFIRIRKLLRKVKNTKALLRHVGTGVDRIRGQLSLRLPEWSSLLRFLEAAAKIKEAVATIRGHEGVQILKDVSQKSTDS